MQTHPATSILVQLRGLLGSLLVAQVLASCQSTPHFEATPLDDDGVVFDDKNGNHTLENGESFGSWHADSGVLSDQFAVSGMLSERVLQSGLLPRLFFSAKVEGIVSEDNPDSALVLSVQDSFPER